VDLGVFPAATAHDGVPKITAAASARGVGSPSEPDRRQVTAHPCCSYAAPPSRFLAPPALEAAQVHLHRACLTRLRRRPQGFSPSRRLAPCAALRPCFVPLALMGFHPSELLPPNEAVAPLDARIPPAVSRCSSRCIRPAPGPGTSPESVTRGHGVTRTRGRCSHGLQASAGHCDLRAGESDKHPRPPMGFATPPLRGPRTDHASPARRPSGVLLDSRPDTAALATTSALMRFSTSSPLSRVRRPSHPGSWFHLGSRATSPRPADRLRMGPRLLPESPES
jgi:hypothetical protein